ncbi:MAG TPA: hypothetical protein VEM58_02060 [Streptosporangiaceae bacterium]|nr:hypothetical protein [Streptosporangiaceae bacterium]
MAVLGGIARDGCCRGSRLGFAPSPGKHDELAHIRRPPDGCHDLGSLSEVRPDGSERAGKQLGHGQEQQAVGQRAEGSFLSRPLL